MIAKIESIWLKFSTGVNTMCRSLELCNKATNKEGERDQNAKMFAKG